MCLLLILWRTSAEAPILLASNREEYFDRPFDPPTVQPGSPRVLCGRDQRAGGTWLGVNEHGLLVAVTNRFGQPGPAGAPSRGILCRRMLDCPSAQDAADLALTELSGGEYAGANYLCLDRREGRIVEGDRPVRSTALAPGLHLVTNGNHDDPGDMRQNFARWLIAPRFPATAAEFVAAAQRVLAQGPDASGERTIVVRQDDRGTVSSSIVVLAARPEQSLYYFAAGSPDRAPYEDCSPALRAMLARSR